MPSTGARPQGARHPAMSCFGPNLRDLPKSLWRWLGIFGGALTGFPTTDPTLGPCQVCGAPAWMTYPENGIIISCKANGCQSVEARTFEEARELWNKPRKWLT
jgi:hypothetical protein